jgi:hypothetical protein
MGSIELGRVCGKSFFHSHHCWPASSSMALLSPFAVQRASSWHHGCGLDGISSKDVRMPYRTLSDAFALWTQQTRAIRLRLPRSHAALQEALLVRRVTGYEALCGGSEHELLCLSPREDLALKDFMALPVEVQLVTDQGGLRSVCGLVAEVHAGQIDGNLSTYRLVLRDALSLLGQRINTRVFLHASEADVTQILTSEWRQGNPLLASCLEVDWSLLAERYPVREFIMQHNEPDADFLRRLWKRRGIGWHIRPAEPPTPGHVACPRHTLVLFNDGMQLPRNAAGDVPTDVTMRPARRMPSCAGGHAPPAGGQPQPPYLGPCTGRAAAQPGEDVDSAGRAGRPLRPAAGGLSRGGAARRRRW